MAEYIDKQKLLKEFDKRYCDQCDDWEGLRCRQCEINQAIGIVEIARAADVVEVKHGKWIEKEIFLDIYYDCSVCGESFCFIEGNPTDNSYQYCPNCGAKMDGDSNAR